MSLYMMASENIHHGACCIPLKMHVCFTSLRFAYSLGHVYACSFFIQPGMIAGLFLEIGRPCYECPENKRLIA